MLNSTPRSSNGQPLEGNQRLPQSNEARSLTKIASVAVPRSTVEPHCHTGLEGGRIALRIEAQAHRIAVVITDRALGLPSCKRPKRQELGDERRGRFARAHP